MTRIAKIRLAAGIALGVALCISASSFAAGFDCKRAKTPTERAICADERLSELDEALAVTYLGALRRADDTERIVAEQRKWLVARNSCGADTQCVQRAYEARLAEMGTDELYAESDAVLLHCDGRTETATITPPTKDTAASSNPEQRVLVPSHGVSVLTVSAGDWYGECKFASGMSVRVKVGHTDLWPYGRCGADPGSFFSAWVNQAKVASRLDLRSQCGTDALVKAVLGKHSLRTCYVSSDGALTCSSVPIVASSEARDPDEYPVRQASKRHPGSYVVEYSAKAGLCNSMLFEPSTDPNRPYWHIALPATGAADLLEEDVEPSGGHEPKVVLSNFDMNNDGTLESVVSIHFESRTRESTTFFAQRDDAVEKTGTEFDGAFLQEHTALVFPHTWSGCRGGFNWADAQSWDDQGCRVPLKHYKHTYDITHLRLRPFRSGGKTYFLGLEPHYLSGSIVTVWEPQASGAAKEVCIFRQVVNNY